MCNCLNFLTFYSFVSENKVYVDGKLVYGDAINLDRDLGNNKRKCSFKESLKHTKVSYIVT